MLTADCRGRDLCEAVGGGGVGSKVLASSAHRIVNKGWLHSWSLRGSNLLKKKRWLA